MAKARPRHSSVLSKALASFETSQPFEHSLHEGVKLLAQLVVIAFE